MSDKQSVTASFNVEEKVLREFKAKAILRGERPAQVMERLLRQYAGMPAKAEKPAADKK